MNKRRLTEPILLAILCTTAIIHTHSLVICTPPDCVKSHLWFIEVITLIGMVAVGALLGAVHSAGWAPRVRSKKPVAIEGLLILVIGSAAFAHTGVQGGYINVPSTTGPVLEAATLVIIISAGSMLGAHYGARMSLQ